MRRLGLGGMGEVWKAHDRITNRTVAIKVLRADIAGAPAAEMRFQREIKATSRLHDLHGVVPVIDAGSDPKVGLYFVMTLEIGLPMHEAWLKWSHWSEAWPYIEQLLNTLAGAHALGVIHRDIKPDNIFIKADGDAVLLDFGVARLRDQARSGTSKYDMLGTVEYAAPEQATGARRRIGPWTDLYCFGIVLWEMICGRLPFHASSPVQSLMIRLENSCPMLDPRPGFTIPIGLDDVLQKMLNPAPGDRFVHAVEVRNALAHLSSGPFETRNPAQTPPPPPMPPAPRDTPTNDEAARLMAKRQARFAYGADGSLLTDPLQPPIPRTPFLGRDRMLLTLSRALDQWCRHPRLGVLVISGAGGTGKSRLVQELVTPFLAAAQIDTHRHRWSQGRSMREVILTLIGGIALPEKALREQAHWFLRLQKLHDSKVRDRLVDWIAGREAVDEVAEARIFTRILKSCATRPFILVIDGLRQLNQDVLRLVDAVRARELPMLVILITRDPRAPRGVRQPSWVEKATWTLEPLTDADIERMLSEIADLPAHERAHMVRSARGNPARLTEDVRIASRAGQLVPAWPRWITPPPEWDPPSAFEPSMI